MGSVSANIEDVYEIFTKRNYKLLINELPVDFRANHTKLPFMCDNGHEHNITLSNIKSGQSCGTGNFLHKK